MSKKKRGACGVVGEYVQSDSWAVPDGVPVSLTFGSVRAVSESLAPGVQTVDEARRVEGDDAGVQLPVWEAGKLGKFLQGGDSEQLVSNDQLAAGSVLAALNVDAWKPLGELVDSDRVCVVLDAGELYPDPQEEVAGEEVQAVDPAQALQVLVPEAAASSALLARVSAMLNVVAAAAEARVPEVGSSPGDVQSGHLLWRSVFPRNAKTLVAEVSSSGKYAVPLFVDGAWRAVVVDDNVPVDADGQCVLPTSRHPSVIWPWLVAKAVLVALQLKGIELDGEDTTLQDRHVLSLVSSCVSASMDSEAVLRWTAQQQDEAGPELGLLAHDAALLLSTPLSPAEQAKQASYQAELRDASGGKKGKKKGKAKGKASNEDDGDAPVEEDEEPASAKVVTYSGVTATAAEVEVDSAEGIVQQAAQWSLLLPVGLSPRVTTCTASLPAGVRAPLTLLVPASANSADIFCSVGSGAILEVEEHDWRMGRKAFVADTTHQLRFTAPASDTPHFYRLAVVGTAATTVVVAAEQATGIRLHNPVDPQQDPGEWLQIAGQATSTARGSISEQNCSGSRISVCSVVVGPEGSLGGGKKKKKKKPKKGEPVAEAGDEPLLVAAHVLLGDGELGRFAAVRWTDLDSLDTRTVMLLDCPAVSLPPNERGHLLSVEVHLPADHEPVDPSDWLLTLTSSAPIDVDTQPLESAQRFTGTQGPTKEWLLFREVIAAEGKAESIASVAARFDGAADGQDSAVGLVCRVFRVSDLEANAEALTAGSLYALEDIQKPVVEQFGMNACYLPPLRVSQDNRLLLECRVDPSTLRDGTDASSAWPLSWSVDVLSTVPVTVAPDTSRQTLFEQVKSIWFSKSKDRSSLGEASRDKYTSTTSQAGPRKQPIVLPPTDDTRLRTQEDRAASDAAREAGLEAARDAVARQQGLREQEQAAGKNRTATSGTEARSWRQSHAGEDQGETEQRQEFKRAFMEERALVKRLRATLTDANAAVSSAIADGADVGAVEQVAQLQAAVEEWRALERKPRDLGPDFEEQVLRCLQRVAVRLVRVALAPAPEDRDADAVLAAVERAGALAPSSHAVLAWRKAAVERLRDRSAGILARASADGDESEQQEGSENEQEAERVVVEPPSEAEIEAAVEEGKRVVEASDGLKVDTSELQALLGRFEPEASE